MIQKRKHVIYKKQKVNAACIEWNVIKGKVM